MNKPKKFLVSLTPLSLLAFVLLLVGCGSAATTTTGSSTSPTATPPPTVAATTAPTATTGGSSAAVVMTASGTVQGKTVTLLTDSKGLTLYYRTSDTASSVCSGGCAVVWPPLLFSGSGSPTSGSSISGTLTVSSNTNGSQVEYQGHPLYTYQSDTAAGQTSGEGVGGVWFVATTDLKSAQSTGLVPGY